MDDFLTKVNVISKHNELSTRKGLSTNVDDLLWSHIHTCMHGTHMINLAWRCCSQQLVNNEMHPIIKIASSKSLVAPHAGIGTPTVN